MQLHAPAYTSQKVGEERFCSLLRVTTDDGLSHAAACNLSNATHTATNSEGTTIIWHLLSAIRSYTCLGPTRLNAERRFQLHQVSGRL
ncbi:hypothetical protein FB45DRAFT_1043343 [Roridomyces roridus]|uniref:Uncharacterized protein n=1 Tax=Roridomyces roridus TaxID=1738132 RepID=A0AAD7F6E2_9AGAR|nr:hypothetical protein FB45DRAFT_1043343 [Roridomyces roridus]